MSAVRKIINDQKRWLLLYIIWSNAILFCFMQSLLAMLLNTSMILCGIFIQKWRIRKYFYMLLIGLIAISSYWMLQMFFSIWNTFSVEITRLYRWKLPLMEPAIESLVLFTLFILSLHLLLLTWNKRWLTLVITGVAILLFTILQKEQFVSALLIIMTQFSLYYSWKSSLNSNWKILLQRGIPLVLLFSLLYLVEKQWGNPLQFMPQKVNEIVHDKRFNVNDATTFEEGQVQKVEKLSQSEAIALTVRMEQPQAMYLKGFIGSSFNRNEWRALSNEKALAVDSYFYWLEKGRFTSNTMLSQLQKAQGKVEQSNVVIHLDHAMTKYAYVPYELNSFQKSTNLNLDGLTYNEKLFSKKDYTYGIQTGSLQNYALSAAKLKEKNKEIESYLKLEGNYRKVVYENYLDVSKENEEVVADDFLHKKDLSYEEAIEYVQKKLDEKMTYKKAVELKEDDVVSAIWQTERSGFSTHYATIGTLAFRMMGIPARYVEGYLVTPQLVEEKKAYEEIKVREKNAHAWTEIYIDQIGWVPIEVTTPFIQIMPKIKVAYTPESEAGHSASQSNDAQSNMASASNHKTQIEERPEILSPQPKKEKETIKWQVVSIILLLFIVLVIGVILLLKLRKRRKVIRLLWQQVTSENEKESIVASIQLVHYWFENIMGINCMNQPLHEQLNQLNGELSEETLKLYEESFIAYQALRYGGIATKKTTLVEEVKKEVIDSKKWLQKVTLKWWKGYY